MATKPHFSPDTQLQLEQVIMLHALCIYMHKLLRSSASEDTLMFMQCMSAHQIPHIITLVHFRNAVSTVRGHHDSTLPQ